MENIHESVEKRVFFEQALLFSVWVCRPCLVGARLFWCICTTGVLHLAFVKGSESKRHMDVRMFLQDSTSRGLNDDPPVFSL